MVVFSKPLETLKKPSENLSILPFSGSLENRGAGTWTRKFSSHLPEVLKLPSNSSANSLENFGIDLKAAFTHRFGKFCNDQYKCADIKPYQAFETLITEYTVGENSNGLLETKDIIVQKKSKVYDSYLKRITHFPEIVCQ